MTTFGDERRCRREARLSAAEKLAARALKLYALEADCRAALDLCGWPDFLTSAKLAWAMSYVETCTNPSERQRNARQMLLACGYEWLRNPHAKRGRWKVLGQQQVCYRKVNAPLLKHADVLAQLKADNQL